MLKYKKGDKLSVTMEVSEDLSNPIITYKIYDLLNEEIVSGTGSYDSENQLISCLVDFTDTKITEGLYEIQIKVLSKGESKIYYQLIEVEK